MLSLWLLGLNYAKSASIKSAIHDEIGLNARVSGTKKLACDRVQIGALCSVEGAGN